MHKLLLMPLLALALVFAAVAAADADPTGTLTVSVPATAGDAPAPATWVDTGFDLKPAAPAITVTASGIAQFCGVAGLPGFGGCSTTPDGPVTGGLPLVPGGCPACPLPGALIGALIAQVGSAAPVLVGSSATLTGSGRLRFAYQDGFGDHFDNVGSYTAVITYPCQPGNGNGDENHYHCGPPGQG